MLFSEICLIIYLCLIKKYLKLIAVTWIFKCDLSKTDTENITSLLNLGAIILSFVIMNF